MELKVEFTLAEAEFQAAMRELCGSTLRRGVMRAWAVAGLMFLLLAALLALFLSSPSELLEPFVFIFAAWLVALPIVWFRAPSLASREIAPAFLERTQFSADSASFSVARQTFAGSGSWDYFATWSESPDFFLLSHSPSVVLLVPKRALSSEQVVEMRALLIQVIAEENR